MLIAQALPQHERVLRADGNDQDARTLGYSWNKDKKLEMQGLPSPVGVSFDSWGHLVMDFGDHVRVLKLISTNTTEQQPAAPPVKIALVYLQGDTADQ